VNERINLKKIPRWLLDFIGLLIIILPLGLEGVLKRLWLSWYVSFLGSASLPPPHPRQFLLPRDDYPDIIICTTQPFIRMLIDYPVIQHSLLRHTADKQDHGFPHVLVLQVANAFYKLYVNIYPSTPLTTSPGGYLDPNETDQEGLLTRLDECLGVPNNEGGYTKPSHGNDWQVAECLSIWWRPNLDTFAVSYR
jgi:hypothetical protein